jgi:hypothetical protein
MRTAKQGLMAIGTVVVISGTIVDGHAASTLKMMCSGNLTNTRADGVTLGQCDLKCLRNIRHR